MRRLSVLRSPEGFTLIEIVVVLILMSIIAATVLGRSITTEEIDLNAQTDRIANHIRYAQATAMKRTDTVWGIKSDATAKKYWLFSGTSPDTGEDPLPGISYEAGVYRVDLAELGVDLSEFTLIFDRIGKPYTIDASSTPPVVALENPLSINITNNAGTRSLTVIPETGLIQ
jgi:prepilin-type N-terminal cleavage/methylation domain-containing protein